MYNSSHKTAETRAEDKKAELRHIGGNHMKALLWANNNLFHHLHNMILISSSGRITYRIIERHPCETNVRPEQRLPLYWLLEFHCINPENFNSKSWCGFYHLAFEIQLRWSNCHPSFVVKTIGKLRFNRKWTNYDPNPMQSLGSPSWSPILFVHCFEDFRVSAVRTFGLLSTAGFRLIDNRANNLFNHYPQFDVLSAQTIKKLVAFFVLVCLSLLLPVRL